MKATSELRESKASGHCNFLSSISSLITHPVFFQVNGWEEHYREKSFLFQCKQRFGPVQVIDALCAAPRTVQILAEYLSNVSIPHVSSAHLHYYLQSFFLGRARTFGRSAIAPSTVCHCQL